MRPDLEAQEQVLGLRIYEIVIDSYQNSHSGTNISENSRHSDTATGTVTLPGEKNNVRGVTSSIRIDTEIFHSILNKDDKEQIFGRLQSLHEKATAQSAFISDEINAGNITFSKDKTVNIDNKSKYVVS